MFNSKASMEMAKQLQQEFVNRPDRDGRGQGRPAKSPRQTSLAGNLDPFRRTGPSPYQKRGQQLDAGGHASKRPRSAFPELSPPTFALKTHETASSGSQPLWGAQKSVTPSLQPTALAERAKDDPGRPQPSASFSHLTVDRNTSLMDAPPAKKGGLANSRWAHEPETPPAPIAAPLAPNMPQEPQPVERRDATKPSGPKVQSGIISGYGLQDSRWA